MSDLLPYNATEQEKAISISIERAGEVPVRVREVWNPYTCPADVLPWLAWAFSVDSWDANWTEQEKRDVIATSILVHKKKGTIGAVRRALRPLGYDIEIEEWFQKTPVGDPYTFSLIIDTSVVGIDQSGYNKVLNVLFSSKNLRSHLESIQPKLNTKTGPFVGAITLIGSEIEVAYEPPVLVITENIVIG